MVAERTASALELGRMIERDDTVSSCACTAASCSTCSTAGSAARWWPPRGCAPSGAGGHVVRRRGRAAALRGPVDRLVPALGDLPGLVGVLDAVHVGLLVPADTDLDALARALAVVEPEAVLAAGAPVGGCWPPRRPCAPRVPSRTWP